MRVQWLCCLWIGLFMLLSPVGAQGQTPLEKPVYLCDTYYFGMKRSVVASVPRVGPCEGMDSKEVLCSDDGMLGDLKWGRLFFFEQERLTSVVLYSEEIEAHFDQALKSMEQRGYTLVALTNAQDDTFDILKHAVGHSAQAVQADMKAFEEAAIASARIMYTYFSTDSKPKNMGGLSGWRAWADAAPDTLRMAQVELSVPQYVRITFSAPKAQLTP